MPKLSSATQESLLALICFDDSSGKSIRALITPKVFDPFFRQIAEEADKYWEKYKKCPNDHTVDIIEALIEREPDSKQAYDTIRYSLFATKDSINREYVVGQVQVFARRQKAKATLTKSVQLLQQGTETALQEAESLMSAVGKNTIDLQSPGLLLNDPAQALRFLSKDPDQNTFPLGIPELDKYHLGPARKKYHLTVACTNTGKSWMAVQQGKMALMHGYRVLHVTLEMDEDEVAQRYVQSLFSVSKRVAKQLTRHFEKDESGRFLSIEERQLKRPTLQQDDIAKLLTAKLAQLKHKPSLYVKEFPSGSLTVRKLKAFMDYLESVHNFSPDLTIVDYPDLFEIDVKHKRESIDRIAVDLRGIAGERNIGVSGFSQVNETRQGNLIKTGRAFESRGKEHTADIVLSLNQTEAEYELGLLRVFVAKSRTDVKHLKVLISQNLALGQFCLDSCLMSEGNYWQAVNENGDNGE